MDDYSGGGGGGGAAGGMLMMGGMACVSILVLVGFCAFYGYCIKKIGEKTGKEVGFLAYVPILQLLPIFDIIGWEKWKLVLFFIPLVGAIFGIMAGIELCKVRGKSPWMVLIALIPCTGWAFLPYLAFSE